MKDVVLSKDEKKQFFQRGYIKLEEAFAKQYAIDLEEAIWKRLTKLGMDRDDPSTWHKKPRGLKSIAWGLDATQQTGDRIIAAVEALTGDVCSVNAKNWGRLFFNFPDRSDTPWDIPYKLWHWDMVSCFGFISCVRPQGGGTLIVGGSHRLVQRYLDRLTEKERSRKVGTLWRDFNKSHPWLAELSGEIEDQGHRVQRFMEEETLIDDVPCRVVELTGNPGDAYICHPHILHTASVNKAKVPRMMRGKIVFSDSRILKNDRKV